MKRDYPAIAEALSCGEYRSVRAAGFVRKLKPLDYLHRYWRKVSPQERARFLVEMLTPAPAPRRSSPRQALCQRIRTLGRVLAHAGRL